MIQGAFTSTPEKLAGGMPCLLFQSHPPLVLFYGNLFEFAGSLTSKYLNSNEHKFAQRKWREE
jgi:hypothetical protein